MSHVTAIEHGSITGGFDVRNDLLAIHIWVEKSSNNPAIAGM